MDGDNESILLGYPNIISYECIQKIIEQMEKSICKIKIGHNQATGFFCKIPFPDKENMLPILITNNHVIENEVLYKDNEIISIKIKEDDDFKKINLSKRLKYSNEEYDITMIEIKDSDEIKNYLELDDKIIDNIIKNKNKNSEYIDETVYVIQYPKGKLGVSFGILEKIFEDKKYNFSHKCSTEGGSSGAPILNLNNKIIGIHKQGTINNKFNKGTFLNYSIKEFIKMNYKSNNIQDIVINNDKNNISHKKEKITNYNEILERFEYFDYFDENELLAAEFISKYNLNLNFKGENILFMSLNLRDEGFKDLCQIEFPNLKKLYLNENNISDIRPLEKAKFNKLEFLGLGDNIISDINILEKVNLKKLTFLDLHGNYISDITILAKFNFPELEKLYLGYNRISDINVLETVNFKKLKEFSLSGNTIDIAKNSIIISKMKSKLKKFDV